MFNVEGRKIDIFLGRRVGLISVNESGETKMTLIVAICTEEKDSEGIIISSDSQATVGPVTYRVKKIVPIMLDEEPLALVAGAGDTALVKKATEAAEEILIKNSIREWNAKTPSYDQFKQAISEIETSLIEKISFYRERKLRIDFDFIVGSLDSTGKASLFVFDKRGMAHPVHDDPGFACIGSGFYLGGNLLLQQFYSRPIDWLDAANLAAYVINQVSRVDAGVGPFEGDSFYFRLSPEKELSLGDMTRLGFQRRKREYDWRRKLLKYVWNQSSILGAKEIYTTIKKGIKESKKKSKEKSKKAKT